MKILIYANTDLATLWQSQLDTKCIITKDNKELELHLSSSKIDFVFIQSKYTYEISLVASSSPHTKLIVLSDTLSSQECLQVLQLGAFAYLSSYSHTSLLHHAITSKTKLLPPSIISELISSYLHQNPVCQDTLDTLLSLDKISNIQKLIIILISTLKTDTQIQSILNMSAAEFYHHLRLIVAVFDTKDRLDFVTYITRA